MAHTAKKAISMPNTLDPEIHNVLPAGYEIVEYVLIVEKRICECCGSSFSTPSPHLRVRVENKAGASRTISLQSMHELYAQISVAIPAEKRNPTLPRRHQYVILDVPACMHCFEEIAAEDAEADMFPVKRPLTAKQILREKEYSNVLLAKYKRMPTKDEMDAYGLVQEMERELKRKNSRKSKAAPKKTFSLVGIIAKYKK